LSNRNNLSQRADEIAAFLDKNPQDTSRKGHDVSHENRVPKGNPGGGQFTRGSYGDTRKRRAAADPKDEFFETMNPIANAMAAALGIPDTWILGVSAHESEWMAKHARENNNPFGLTHKGGRNVDYDSLQKAADYWMRRFGRAASEARTPEEFAQRLFEAGYNSRDPDWRQKIVGAIHSVEVRQQVREDSVHP
jgi:flagellum-specific peptidoglycan hydrolase FlgJ